MHIAILGTGMAGLGAGYALEQLRIPFTCYDKNSYLGGHTRSIQYRTGFVFDEGGHISFCKDDHVKNLFAANVDGQYEEQELRIDNYWRGYRIPHPVQCNLRGLPTDLITNVIRDFVEANARHCSNDRDVRELSDYKTWLYDTYGKTFAETFPIVYGEKYHTTKMDCLTTDWIGPRMYKPTLEEILRGALRDSSPRVHYVNEFRYPTRGGFVSYIQPFVRRFDIRLDHEVTQIDTTSKLLHFRNGIIRKYSHLISSIPLPELIAMIRNVPCDVLAASRKLAFTSALLVNIGLDREDISETAITYFYDQDIAFSRVNLPYRFSRSNAPPGCGSIQAEIYFSDKYMPLTVTEAALAEKVVANLRHCGFIRPNDAILLCDTTINRYANVIYDHDRAPAVQLLKDYLTEVGIFSCGRYGRWNHAWTDQAFLDGETTAKLVAQDESR